MRVLYATETFLPSVDGVVTRMTHALDRLAELGHEAAVVCPGLGVDSYRGFPVVGTLALRYPLYRSRKWGAPSPVVARAVRRFAPDVVHVWHPLLVGSAAVLACERKGVPLITSYHTNVDQYLACYGAARVLTRPAMWLMRRLNNSSPITLVPSRAMSDYLGGRGFTGLRVLSRGVDLDARDPRYRDPGMRARLCAGDPDAPLLLFVGRVAPEKGLGSLEPLMRSHPEWRLAVVGDGPALPDLRRRFAGTKTTFTGFLRGEELSRAYASADAFLFPSVTETLGLVLLEAMASGLPVVAADSPATRDQVTPGVDCLLYDPADAASLERAVARLLGDPDLRGALRANGLAGARANGWQRASDALIDAYRDTIDAYEDGWARPRRPARAGGARR